MATLSVRTAVKLKLSQLLTTALPGVQVSYGFPGQQMERECVYIGKTHGPVTVPVVRGGGARVTRQDEFTTDVWCWAGQKSQSALEAEQRAEVLYEALETTLATDPTLGAVDGLKWAILGNVEGPESEPTNEGFAAYVRAEVVCLTRLT